MVGVTNVVIGNNVLVVEAAVAEARRLGLAPCLLTRRLQGEAQEAARVFAASWTRRPAAASFRAARRA